MSEFSDCCERLIKEVELLQPKNKGHLHDVKREGGKKRKGRKEEKGRKGREKKDKVNKHT